MQGGKNWILPKQMNANRFFWDSHWLEIWSNHLLPSMGPNGGIVAMDSEKLWCSLKKSHMHRAGKKRRPAWKQEENDPAGRALLVMVSLECFPCVRISPE
jgi:hypothetical protein